MKIKNWKTTLAGAIFAGLLIAVKLWMSGSLDPATILIAGGMASIAALASDHDIDQFIKNSFVAYTGLTAIDAVSGTYSASHPNDLMLKGIHDFLDKLKANVDALPATIATAVAATQAPAAVVEFVAPEPKAEAAPLTELYNKFSGKLLTEDPYPAA